jgi:uncharacterized small protein (DUF1192 family)
VNVYEELELQTKRPAPRDIELMSIDALHEYIVELNEEIDRVRQAITVKEAAKGVAESVFRS